MDDQAIAPRAARIVAALPLAEKVALLSGAGLWHLEAIEGAGIPPIMLTDGPHGIRKATADAQIGLGGSVPATCFPPAATLAASWDASLAEEVGRAIGEEARAEGVSVVLGPGLNLKRHPACGRNFEYFSEDPLLSGTMAGALARGIQSVGVGACLKHFALNNQERNRMTVDVVVDERTARELYLRGFEIAVREARPWTVMCAYNRVNGEHCSDSRWLLTEVLREDWGFDGLVMSDWGAVNDRVAGVRAGLDLEMPSSAGANDLLIIRALKDGTLAEEDLDPAARRVVELQLRSVDARDATASYDAEAHHRLARRVAVDSTVLLTNDGLLPLDPAERIAVIGAFATQPRYQGAGSSQIVPTRIDTLLDTLRERLGAERVPYAAGYTLPDAPLDEPAIEEARAIARAADAVVLMLGLPEPYESEAFDRPDLRLPEQHDRLVDAICDANPRTVVVLSNGAPVELPWAERPAALVEAYLGGQASGSALADILLGENDPGGRLAETFPLKQTDLLADRAFPGEPRQVRYRENLYVGYRQFASTGQPVRFPFGHGLSYAAFDMGEITLSTHTLEADERVTVQVPIRTTGERGGCTVVQLYVSPADTSTHRPERELRAFAKVRLGAGVETRVGLELGPDAFSVWDVASHGWRTASGDYDILVGFSCADIRASATIAVRSGFTLTEPPPAGLLADDAEFAQLLGGPIPPPEPTRPFTRTSTLEEVGATALGRLIRHSIRSAIAKQFAAGGEVSTVTERMLDSVVGQLPLRALVSMGGGRVSYRMLDAIVLALNGRWFAALARAVRRQM